MIAMERLIMYLQLYGFRVAMCKILYKIHIISENKYEKSVEKHFKQIKTEDYEKYLKLWYKFKTGIDFDINNPIGLSQKLQWMKLYGFGEIETQLCDKYLVRDWVELKIGNQFLIPLLGVYDTFDQIDFTSLPESFVIKTNHGTANVIVVKDKSLLDIEKTAVTVNEWMQKDYSMTGSFEMQYKNIPRKIIIEEYVTDANGELNDYKFMCINGEPQLLWVDQGRFTEHTRSFFDMNWNCLDISQFNYGARSTYPPIPNTPQKPINFEMMVELVKILAHDFAEVRVDLYNADGKIFFGEMTFTSGGGIELFTSDNLDYRLGELLTLPTKGN